jgi:hypothetical protein
VGNTRPDERAGHASQTKHCCRNTNQKGNPRSGVRRIFFLLPAGSTARRILKNTINKIPTAGHRIRGYNPGKPNCVTRTVETAPPLAYPRKPPAIKTAVLTVGRIRLRW